MRYVSNAALTATGTNAIIIIHREGLSRQCPVSLCCGIGAQTSRFTSQNSRSHESQQKSMLLSVLTVDSAEQVLEVVTVVCSL